MECDLGGIDIGEDIECELNVTYADIELGETTTLTVMNSFNIIDSTGLNAYCGNPRISYSFIENDFDEIDEYMLIFEGYNTSDLISACGINGSIGACNLNSCVDQYALLNDYSDSNVIDIGIYVSKGVEGINSTSPFNDICPGGYLIQSTITLTCQRSVLYLLNNVMFAYSTIFCIFLKTFAWVLDHGH